MAEGMRPPEWRRHWPPILAVLLWSVILIIGTAWLVHEPEAPLPALPIHVEANVAAWTPEGRWRVETQVTIESECRIEVRRQFSPPPASGTPRPVASHLDPLHPGDFPYLIDAQPGTSDGRVWYEYALPPEMVGAEYLIEVIAWQCVNGYTGPVGRWIVPVGPKP